MRWARAKSASRNIAPMALAAGVIHPNLISRSCWLSVTPVGVVTSSVLSSSRLIRFLPLLIASRNSTGSRQDEASKQRTREMDNGNATSIEAAGLEQAAQAG